MKRSLLAALLPAAVVLAGRSNSYRFARTDDAAERMRPLIALGERVLVTTPNDGA